jgi:iron complex transport system ATP-binding protein
MPADDAFLVVEDLCVELGGQTILEKVSFRVAKGGFTALLGPNGSGKTTLLRAICRHVPWRSGRVLIGGEPASELGARALATRVAVLRQEVSLGFDFTVEEIVRMGRSPYKGLLDGDTEEDRSVVKDALALTDMSDLAERSFLTLSGGEQQRVLLARAIAQRPSLLLLDEPTSHLDIRHQLEILTAISKLGLTVLAAVHDLNSALRFASEGVLLDRGRVFARGPIGEVLSEERIREVFGVDADRAIAENGQVVLGFRPRLR